jgi:hypothetical protein
LQLINPEPKGGIASIFKCTVALRESSLKKHETKLHNGNQNALGVFILAKSNFNLQVALCVDSPQFAQKLANIRHNPTGRAHLPHKESESDLSEGQNRKHPYLNAILIAPGKVYPNKQANG